MAGATVFVTDRNAVGASVADELAAEGLNARFLELDITDAEAWRAVVEQVIAATGRLDILINNAGYFDAAALDELDPHNWELAFAVNTTGALHGIRATARVMEAGSAIVNVSSVFGLLGTDLVGVAYRVSKGALLPLTRSAAVQLAPRGIRVNAVCPGLIRTPMTETLFADPGTRARILAQVPLGREVDVFDIVNAVLFLASPISGYTTGAGGVELREALVHTLLSLMCVVEDTTVLNRRCDPSRLRATQRLARESVDAGGPGTDGQRRAVEELCRLFVAAQISPGGCADLTAMSLCMHLWETEVSPWPPSRTCTGPFR